VRGGGTAAPARAPPTPPIPISAPAAPDLLPPAPGAPPPARSRRPEVAYERRDDRFRIADRSYGDQYAATYFSRLAATRPDLEKAAEAAWPGVPRVSVLQLPENEDVVVIGTLYKDCALKPSALDEYAKEMDTRGADAPVREVVAGIARLAADTDTLVLEDAGARVALAGLPPGPLVTGVVAALRGRVGEDGALAVEGALFRGPGGSPPPRPPPAAGAGAADGDRYIAFVSRLAAAPGDAAGAAAAGLAVDLLTGHAGAGALASTLARVARVVVAGGLLAPAAPATTGADAVAPARPSAAAAARAALGPLRDADALATALASSLPVDIVPGPGDATNAGLPQQPVHRCLLPGAAPAAALTRATNPHEFDAGGARFLGTAGQNVDDVLRYSTAATRVEAMASLLAWGHVAPTAPDTLPCHPFTAADPFVLQGAPHVFFAGGAAALEVGEAAVEGGGVVRLLAVPDFQATRTIALLNLRTLDVQPLVVEAP